MRSKPIDQQTEPVPGIANNQTDPPREPGDAGRNDVELDTGATTDYRDRAADQEGADKPGLDRKWRPELRSAPGIARRLGPLEYTLLGLIALAVAVTIVMAVVNPPG